MFLIDAGFHCFFGTAVLLENEGSIPVACSGLGYSRNGFLSYQLIPCSFLPSSLLVVSYHVPPPFLFHLLIIAAHVWSTV